MDPEEYADHLHLLAAKARRARRREHANFDPRRLHAFYDAQGWPEPSTLDMFRQVIKAYRHSCHAGCCTWPRYVKRMDRRQDRHQAKMALAKRCDNLRRKTNYASEADWKGT